MKVFRSKTDESKLKEAYDLLDSNYRTLKLNYDHLFSQYNEQIKANEISLRSENEVSRFLVDLENSLTSFNEVNQESKSAEQRKKTPKERVQTIVDAVNSQQKEFLDIIEKLKQRLVATQKEIEEKDIDIEDNRIYIDQLHEEIHRLSDEIRRLREQDVSQSVAKKAETSDPDYVRSPTTNLVLEQTTDVQSTPQKAESIPDINTSINTDEKPRKSNSKEDVLIKKLIADANDFLRDNASKINENMWVMIFVIGSQGLSERTEIEAYIKANATYDISSATINTLFNNLDTLGIIDKERIATGRRSNFYIHSLTELGVGLYIKQFHEKHKFKQSEKKLLSKMHDNPQHGYFIKDVKTTLREIGYTDVTDDRTHNTFTFADGQAWIPDIIAINPDGKKEFFECELGNHTQIDFNKKIYKASRVSKEIKFVTRNAESLKNVENLIRNWHSQCKTNQMPIADEATFYVTTLNNLFTRKSFGEIFNPVLVL